ncbi:glycosyltransferase [Yinghuangia sp. ASG 101]|uniref:glycosyltransferase n=1 Tax=Yinghuangia sp. ASG 101 TaxID=2896848 RepID=UPI001E3EFE80|nr:glycosyltransferase [Yinghuangia sp. ASG 101]UGQ08983.1 glycosyltransferase [Yinghuangia sp. ASG 101]
MDVLVWITLVSGVAWLYLAVAHGGFWRTDVRLAPRGTRFPPDDAPSVAIVVPARDEADIIGASLPTLLGQDYPGPVRVILVDDGSTDGTGELARRLGASAGARVPLTVTTPGPPPPGWTGKLWAVRHGVALAHDDPAGPPDHLLLTDADIAHAPDSLARLVAEAEAGPREGRLDLVSVMARLRVRTGWERLIVPAFVYFFGKLFPFRRVNRHGGRTAAAAGGCVLVRSEALARAGGIDAIRDAVIDDVTLGTALKRSGGRIRLVLADPPDPADPPTRDSPLREIGDRESGGAAGEFPATPVHVDSIRPYPTLADLWRMVARSAFAQLRHSWLLLAGTVVGLALVYLAAPMAVVVGAVAGNPPLAAVGAATWAVMTATYVPMVRYYGRPSYEALLLPFAATLYLGMTVDSAVQHARGRGAAWKGRTYPAPDTTPSTRERRATTDG